MILLKYEAGRALELECAAPGVPLYHPVHPGCGSYYTSSRLLIQTSESATVETNDGTLFVDARVLVN